MGVVSYDPKLTAQCLSIKDSLDVLNRDVVSQIYADPSILEKECRLDMATVFFGTIFGRNIAPRVMAGIIAFSIFGNVVVMTFTASRGKCSYVLRLKINHCSGGLTLVQSNRKSPRKASCHFRISFPRVSPLHGRGFANATGRIRTMSLNRRPLRRFCSTGSLA